MTNVTVVGLQWGDEGKGKIVDLLSEQADVVVRFQGGNNAGHTLVIDGTTYKLSLLPSGIVREGKLSVIGNGVVLDIWSLMDEIERIRQLGVNITPENLMIADNTCLILPLHRELDALREENASPDAKIGTLKRGIGPTYEDKVGRRAIRACDLGEKTTLQNKVERLLLHHNSLRKGLGAGEINAQELLESLYEMAPKILPYIKPAWKHLHEAKQQNKKILFEGAQGAMLDIEHGTYPYVTSSNTHAGQVAVGSGAGVGSIGYILGLIKAYTTRVGEGPFPTEQSNDIGELMQKKGNEFGTVSGRSRRCGWVDACMLRQTIIKEGVQGIVLTKIDVLDSLDELKICTGYKLNGQEIDYYPSSQIAQAEVEPIYETLLGWQSKTEGIRNFDALPKEAIQYIRRIEELIGVPIVMISTSPEREDTIVIKNPYTIGEAEKLEA